MTRNGVLAGRRIAVVGLGGLGATLATQLLTAGARVTGVRRGTQVTDGVTLLRADLADPAAIAALPRDIEALVACVTPDAYDPEGYRRTYLEGARSLANALAGRPLARLVWVSSTAVHAQGDDARVDETAPTEPVTDRGRTLLAAEQALQAGGWPVTVLRLAGIYGPGRTALLRRALEGRAAAAHTVHWTNRIHSADAVAAMLMLLQRTFAGTAVPAVVIGSDGAPAPRAEVIAWLADRLGVALGEPLATPDRAPSRRLVPAALLEMGFRWRYPDYRAGFEAIIAEMETDGSLAALQAEVARDQR